MQIPALAQVLERLALLLFVIVSWMARLDFGFFLILAAAAPLIRFLVVLPGAVRHVRPPGLGMYRSLLGEGMLLFAVEAVAGIYLRVDILLLSRLQSLEAAAQYNAAFRMFEAFTLLFAGYLTAIFPSLVRKMRFESLKSSFWLGLGVMLCASAAGILCRNFLLGLFGPSYLEAGSAFIALMLTLPLCYATSFLTNYLVASGRVPLLLRMSVVVVSVNVTLNLVLVPRYSLTGAGCAFLISEIVSCVLMAVLLRMSKVKGLPGE